MFFYFLGGIVSFQRVVLMNNLFMNLFSFTSFVAILNLISLLRYNKQIAKFQKVLYGSFSYLISFFVVFIMLLCAFVSLINIYFGVQLKEYSSFANTVFSLIEAMLGKFSMVEVVVAKGLMGAFCLLVYLLTMMIFVLNFFVAIINNALSDANAVDFTNYSKVIDYFWQTLYNFFGFSNSKAKGNQDTG